MNLDERLRAAASALRDGSAAQVDAATGLREIVLSDVRRELAAAGGAPAEAPTSRILRRSQRLALVVNLLLVVALSVVLARVASHREDPVAAAPAVTATVPAPPVTALAARSKVPEACVDAAELADEVISRLTRNQRDNALALALRDYTIASQACRRAASS